MTNQEDLERIAAIRFDVTGDWSLVPHDETRDCRTAMPTQVQHWCARCLALEALKTPERDWQGDVKAFIVAIGHYAGTRPAVPPHAVADLRYNLVAEEMDELLEALYKGDLAEIAKESADVFYVVLGALCAYGIDFDPVWAAVRASNLAKVGGPVAPGGKLLKKPGWVPPDIKGIIEAQQKGG